MTGEVLLWLDRAEEYGRRAMLRRDLIREWAAGCSEPERRFFTELYQKRAKAAPGRSAATNPRPMLIFTDLSREARYLVESAYARIWQREV